MEDNSRSDNLPPTTLLKFVPAGVAVLCAVVFGVWLLGIVPRSPKETQRMPVKYAGEQAGAISAGKSVNPGTTVAGKGNPSNYPGNWMQFRGARRDNIALSSVTLARQWLPTGPPVLWRLSVGEGHAGAAIYNGRVYLEDYDRTKEEDGVRCVSLDTGEEIWRFSYSVKIKRNHGMSRTVPAVNGRYVVFMGPMCHVFCLDAVTGALVWKKNLVEENGTEIPPWYAGQCPIIDGDRVILAPGARPLMMALDVATGNPIWRTPAEVDNLVMTHSSIVVIEFGGKKQYVYCSGKGVFGISAEDGKVLWTKPDWKIGIANVPTPVWLGDDRIFFTGGYNSGCLMLRLKEAGGKMTTEEIFKLKAEAFGSDQQTPIFYNGNLYGVTSKPESQMVCLSPDGKRVWSSGKETRFGLGPYMICNGMLLMLDDENGTLRMAPAEAKGYHEMAKAKILNGNDAWAPMAMAEGRLILRDLSEVVCLNLGE